MIADRYEILDEIGRGAMGVVHRARDLQLGRTVALKLVSLHVAEDPELRARFLREAHALARVGDPHVVGIYDVGADGARPWLVMELCPGGSLADRLAGGPMAVDEARALLAHAAEALRAIHAAGIVHRDVTPGNVLRGRDGWVIGDFGVAAASGETAITRTGVVLGTPEYWAPEVLGDSPVGPPADVYSLGCVMFHALTGAPPYTGANPLRVGMMHATTPAPALPPEVRRADPALADLVEAMLAKDPAARPSADDLVQGEAPSPRRGPQAVTTTVTTPAETAATRIARPRRRAPGRRRRLVIGLVAVAAAVLGGGATALGLVAGGLIGQDDAATFVAPALRGMTPVAAEQRLGEAAAAAGAEAPDVRTAERRYVNGVARGRVAAQRPAAGRDVDSGGVVRLVVSRGSPETSVPDVEVNGPPAAAITALKARDLGVKVVEEPSFDVPAGGVIGTDPAAGTTVERPAEIVVRVSSGVPMTTVPDLVEISEGDARRELEAAGLEVRVSYEDTDRVAPGAVLSQDPAAGTSVAQGSEVTLVVASEPEDAWNEVFTLGGDEIARTPVLFVGERWRIAYTVEGDGSDGVEVRVLQGRSAVDGFRAGGGEEGRWDGPSGGGPVVVEVIPDGAAEYRLVIEELG